MLCVGRPGLQHEQLRHSCHFGMSTASSSGTTPLSRVNEALARGKALRKLEKAAKEGTLDKSTRVLDDPNCKITIGSLMKSEALDFDQAVQVMLQFRREAMSPPGADEHPKAGGVLPEWPEAAKAEPARKSALKAPVAAPLLKDSRKACGKGAEAEAHEGESVLPAEEKKRKKSKKASNEPEQEEAEEEEEPAATKKCKAKPQSRQL